MNFEDFKKAFLHQVVDLAESGDVWPLPLQTFSKGGLVLCVVATPPLQLLQQVNVAGVDPAVSLIAFGLDRTTKEGQGTTLGNVFTYCIAERGGRMEKGIVEYGEGRVFAPRELVEGDFWAGHWTPRVYLGATYAAV